MTTRAREEDTTPAPAAKKAKVVDGLKSGTVTTFHSSRGFGFITPDAEGMPDVFVHQSAIHSVDDGYRYLTVGEKVDYAALLDESKNKWKATKVYGPGGVALKTKADPRVKVQKGKKGRRGQAEQQEPEDLGLTPEELLARVTTQIEYYLSDKNLAQDKWMRNLLAASQVGAISVDNLLRCNKLKALRPTLAVLEQAATASSAMHWTQLNGSPAIGRGADASSVPPLPNYSPPIVALLTNPVAEKTWKDYRAGYMSAYAVPINVYATAPTPFFIVQAEHKDTIAQAVAAGIQDMDGNAIAGVAEADAKQQEELLKYHYDSLAKLAEAKKERESNKGKKGKRGRGGARQDRKEGPVFVAQEEFPNTQEVFDKIKTIMREYKNSEPLLGEHKSFMHNVFKCHPRAAAKLKYLRQIIIKDNDAFDTHSQCFYLVNKDGAEEDISYIKCVNNLPATKPEEEE